MKKIIVLFALLLGSIISIAQPITQRGTTSVTVQDARLFAQYNFRPPVFPDTTSANTQIGLDSCGALIFSRDINAYYYRACSPKRWVRVASGGSTSDSAYLSYRPLTDTTFLLCRLGGTRCDTIKINGKGVSTAWLIGGNVNAIPPYIGTIDTKELDVITNNVVRMRVAGNGINRSAAARNRYLMIDTSTRYLFYGDAGKLDSITADNGLTANTISNVQLGGTLIQPTSILTNSNDFTIERQGNGSTLQIVNSSSGVGNNKTALSATSTDGNAGQFSAGNTLIANNDVQGIVKISRTTNIAPSPNYNEIGGAIDFTNPTVNGFISPAISYTNRIASRWENSVSNPEIGSYAKSRFELYGYDRNTRRNLAVVGDGKLILDQYGAGSFEGTPIYRLGVDASGNVIEDTTSGGGGGGVTSISQGYGISNSPNPIIATGTVTVDTSVSGLSGKYLRIVDTTNKFVNNVTKLNDSTITIFKGNTSTNIVLPPSVVYTENPIMSRTSGDSNIIYFNADTANAWRGGGSGTVPTLQQVTTAGAITTDKVTMTGGYGLVTNEFNSLDGAGEKYSVINSFSESIGSIKLNWTDNFNTSFFNPSLEMVGEGSSSQNIIRIKTDEISLQNPDKGVLYMRMQNGTNEPFLYFPATNSVLGDTIATLADVRALAGGGGTGTVTDISQGYGITASPTNPITTSGTIDVDTTTSGLSGKYLRIVDTTDKWVNNISRTIGKDSIIFFVGSTRYAIKDSSGGQNLQQVTDKGATTSNNILVQGFTEAIQYKNNSIEFRQNISEPYQTQTLYPSQYYFGQTDTLPTRSGILAISVNGVKADTSGNITIGGITTPTGYYGAFADTLTQNIVSTTVAYPMNFRVTDLSNGVSVVNNNRVLFANAGIYNLQFSAQLANASTSTEVGVTIWIRKNGVDVSGSSGYIQLPKKGSGLDGEALPSWNFVLSLAAGDSIVWYWRATSTDASIVVFPAGTSPTRPSTASTILTVTQQSGIMAGTGITGIGTSGNAQTGATQVLATGTSGTDFTISSSSNTQTFNLPTASASNRGALSSADWSTFNGKIGAADTSVFQRKSISANTIMANNTASAANVTAQVFKDNAEQNMTNTISWTGTAPTTLVSANYSWQQIGKTVNFQFNVLYTNAGTGVTGMFFTLPSDMPEPAIPTGWSGASGYLYTGVATIHSSAGAVGNSVSPSYIRRNAANSAFEIGIFSGSSSPRGLKISLTYKVP